MRALIVVDVQNDFLPGGALAVPGGDEVIPYIGQQLQNYDLAVATQDWHPPDHMSFACNHEGHDVGDVIQWQGHEQVLWPRHCVQGSHGAALAATLPLGPAVRAFHKGVDRDVDSYSGFYDNGHGRDTGLADFLNDAGVDDVHVAGLATDYCVKFTALDAVQLGFKTTILRAACRAVELKPGDADRALHELHAAGVILS